VSQDLRTDRSRCFNFNTHAGHFKWGPVFVFDQIADQPPFIFSFSLRSWVRDPSTMYDNVLGVRCYVDEFCGHRIVLVAIGPAMEMLCDFVGDLWPLF